jgi:glycosyltransferase involved in cell wall biosynthesis
MTVSSPVSRPGCANPLPAHPGIKVSLLTGGVDRPYAFGLAMALAVKNISLEVIGNSVVDAVEMHCTPNVTFVSLYWEPLENLNLATKVFKILRFYRRLVTYAAGAKAQIIHILWNNKVQLFDRTLLMLYYKALGKKIVLTAHNVNAAKRDSSDSKLNRLTLRIQYRVADHIFVHTTKMKMELLEDFGIQESSVTVIPFGINNSVPNTALSPAQAKQRLGIQEGERTILFFGRIRQYKGLEYLVDALSQLGPGNYRLIVAGEPKKGTEQYMSDIQRSIRQAGTEARIIQKLDFIPDDEAELYFKASDVSVLPYTDVFQSGVLFLAYSFGLPVIATDVGSLSEDIVPGRTGLVCSPRDAADLARSLREYFNSDLYKGLDRHRQEISNYANAHHSWDVVGDMTQKVYTDLLKAPKK